MSKEMKSFRLNDVAVSQLEALSKDYNLSQSQILEQLIRLSYDCCKFHKESYRQDLCDMRLGDQLYNIFLDDRLIGD